MKAFVTGGTGFMGRMLCRALLDDGHEVTVITRGSGALPGGAARLEGNPAKRGHWQEEAARHDVFINLTGARWTAAPFELKAAPTPTRAAGTHRHAGAVTVADSGGDSVPIYPLPPGPRLATISHGETATCSTCVKWTRANSSISSRNTAPSSGR